jgi:ribosomal protein L15
LAEAGLISSAHVSVKLILKGEVKNKKEVKLAAASSAAVIAVQKAGGNFSKTPRLGRPAKKLKKQE